MTLPNPQINDGLGELHPNEIWLLKFMRRRLRYGFLGIKVRNGLPDEVEITTQKFRPSDKEETPAFVPVDN